MIHLCFMICFLGHKQKMFKADTMRKEVYALILSQFFYQKYLHMQLAKELMPWNRSGNSHTDSGGKWHVRNKV